MENDKENDVDYPTRDEENNGLKRLYGNLRNNYPDIGRSVCGIELTDFSYRKKVSYKDTTSMDVVDHIGLGKFKKDLHEKLETVHEPIANVNNITEKINNIFLSL